MERDFKGVWIPKHIWLNEELSMLDKVLLVEIDSLDNSERGCFASNKYLADFCQCSESAVSKSISKLIKMGLLSIKNFDGRKRELKSFMSRRVKSNSQPSKIYESDSQNLQHNNIVNKKDNNTIINSADAQPSKPKNNSKGQLIPTETKVRKQKQNGYIEVLNNLCSNEKVKDALLQYCKFRRSRGLTVQQWELIVKKFKQDSTNKTEQQILDCIEQCIVNGRNSLYYTDYSNNDNKQAPQIQDDNPAVIKRSR